MKRFFFAVFAGVVMLCSIFGQSGGAKDLILVLDISSSMSDYSEEVSDYLIDPFLKEFLRLGDTFHLISFSDEPKLELSRRIRETGDVETIVARILLMYPLTRSSDIVAAADFAERYTADLPGTRSKNVIFITDGKNNAPAGSKNTAVTDDEIASLLSSDLSSRFAKFGATVTYIKAPFSNDVPGGKAPVRAAPTTQSPSSAGTSASTGNASVKTPSRTASPQGQNIPSSPQTSSEAVPRQSPAPLPPRPAPSPEQAPPPSVPAVPGSVSSETLPQRNTPSENAPSVTYPQNTIPPSPVQENHRGTVPNTSSSSGNTQEAAQESPSSVDNNQGTAQDASSVANTSNRPLSPSQDTDIAPIQEDSVPEDPIPDRSEMTRETKRGNSGGAFLSNISLPLLILFILIAALIIGLVIFLMTRKLQSFPGKAVYEASASPLSAEQSPSASKNADMLASYAAGQRKGSGTQSPYSASGRVNNDIPINGPLMLSLFVEDQNTAIGRRNIHTAKSGTTLTIGGGKSDFLMFLVPIPQHIAEVHFDGRNCTFIPKKPKYFPDIGSQSVPACIGKTIRVVSDKHYELFIRIDRFQDPLFKLNRLMHSIHLPGLPED